jgi:hypothetical protein
MLRSELLSSARAASITHEVEVVFDPANPDDSTLHATVRPMGMSVQVRERLALLGPAADSGTLTEDEAAELLELLVTGLRSLVASWDLSNDDGTVVPLTDESIRSLGLDEIVILWSSLQEAAAAGPLETSGPSKP